jgi:hypothetical protein
MSNLDRIWKLYQAYEKTSKPEPQRSDWDYYREGYVEATRQQYELAARRKEKQTGVAR